MEHQNTNAISGSVNRGPVQDLYFGGGDHLPGPFANIRAFNDSVQLTAYPPIPLPNPLPDPYRAYLPNTGAITFTHGDLNLSNIIISGTPGSQVIVGIVDWEQAGWYPEYWEYCKLLIAEPPTHEWISSGWVYRVTRPYELEWTAISEYWSWRCP